MLCTLDQLFTDLSCLWKGFGTRQKTLEQLPLEMILHIAKFCDWKTRKRLSMVNTRLRQVFDPLTRQMEHILVKGNGEDGLDMANFTIVIMIDSTLTYRYKINRDRKVVCQVYMDQKKEKYWPIISRKTTKITDTIGETANNFRFFLQKYNFKAIEIATPEFIDVGFLYSGTRIQHLRVPIGPRGMKLAGILQPYSLAIGQLTPPELGSTVLTSIDISPLPRLRHLIINCRSNFDYEYLIEDSALEILDVTAFERKINIESANNLISSYENGKTTLRRCNVRDEFEITNFGLGAFLLEGKMKYKGKNATIKAFSKCLQFDVESFGYDSKYTDKFIDM